MTTSLNDPTERLAMPRPDLGGDRAAPSRRGRAACDIRPQVARHQGSITGALLIDPATITDQITDRHREIVLCSVSAQRAISAAEQLSHLGYDRVHYLAGGYAAWHHRATTR